MLKVYTHLSFLSNFMHCHTWYGYVILALFFPPQLQLTSYLLRSPLSYQLMKHTQWVLCALPEGSQLWISHGGTRTLNSWTQIPDWVYNQWQWRMTMASSTLPLLSPYHQWTRVTQGTIPVLHQTQCLVALWVICSSLCSQWTVSTLFIWACWMWVVLHIGDCSIGPILLLYIGAHCEYYLCFWC